jgi:hypothetical protein
VVVAQCLDVHASLGQVYVSCEPAKEFKGTCRGFVAVVDVVHVKGRADRQQQLFEIVQNAGLILILLYL